jgi:ribosomal-protein-alanine N-acetyltransferase
MNAQIDISGIVLKTERLILRPWRQSDLDDFYEYASVDGVGQMAGWLPHESKETTQIILDSFINGRKTFALELVGKVIGSLGIETYNEEKFPELANLQGRSIGYVLSKDFWGQGFMPEAVKAVLSYLLDEVGLDFVLISHFVWNGQSRRVIQKCGFQYLQTSVHETRYGTQEPTLEYILKK